MEPSCARGMKFKGMPNRLNPRHLCLIPHTETDEMFQNAEKRVKATLT